MSRALAVALAAAWLTAGLPARADDVVEARARFKRGADLYKEKRWREAMAEFEAAYRAKPHGAIHFNVAQCRERLEEWPGALRSYHDYLREVPDAADRAAVRKAMLRIEERLAKAGVQVLLVYSDPPGARATLDGRERGTAPLHLVLQPGSYALALSLDGHGAWSEKVDVPAGASAVVEVVLRPVPRAAAPPPPPPPPADLAPPPPPAAEAAPVEPAPAPPRARRHLPAWIAAGTAVAAAAAGIWFGASARDDAGAIDAMPEPDGATAQRLASDAQSKKRTANVLYGVAAGAAAAGVTLYLLEVKF